MAFHKRKFPLVSFSWGGDPSREVLVEVEEEEAKADDDDVVSVPMVLAVMAAVVVDMAAVAWVARCDLYPIYRGRGSDTM